MKLKEVHVLPGCPGFETSTRLTSGEHELSWDKDNAVVRVGANVIVPISMVTRMTIEDTGVTIAEEKPEEEPMPAFLEVSDVGIQGTMKCTCGKWFESARNFNGHKRHCKGKPGHT